LKGVKMLLSLGVLFAALSLGRCVPLQPKHNKLLLVSFDGFRWNYDQDVDTPNMDTMAVDGVKAKYMTPPFVTLTSPCHFTLLTGPHWVEGKGRKGQKRNGEVKGHLCPKPALHPVWE
uniref:Ectonucleotide pyrophosphatase/phosphodiesterase 7 n=1 Tax=Cyanoderma ruficeps TaxID=181631 RepID=A0A8C3XD90_9PASS